jgi:predicted small metal-binding protein
MEKFEFKDLGMVCSFVVTGSSVEEVKKKAIEHAQKAHPDVVKSAPMASLEKNITGVIKKVS